MTGRTPRLFLKSTLFFFSIFLFFFNHSAQAADNVKNEDCLECHTDLDHGDFLKSVHRNNLCTSCHKDIKELPHEDKLAKVDCASCHRIEAEIYNSSDHGRAAHAGVTAAAACLDCHGEPHAILDYRNAESPVFRLNIHKTCARCHEDEKKMIPFDLLEKMPVKSYLETVHGKALTEKGLVSSAVCTDCHGSHDLHAPTNPAAKMHWSNVPNTCGKCHENVLLAFKRSVHGKAATAGKREAPVCTDCHGEHTIKSHLDPASSVYTTVISEKTCGHCHDAEKMNTKYRLPSDRLKTYLESYHGLASKYGVITVANCASCHGAHDILPSSEANSSVNKKNLPQTCGKCHPNVGEQLAKGSVHVSPSISRDRIVYWVSVFYIWLIFLVIVGMVLHNLLDFMKKLKLHYKRKNKEGTTLRFTPGERIQHLVLFISFTVLAYTGFALKYADAWWALPFTVVDVGVDWRGALHRIMALIFTTLGVYHSIMLFATKRGRQQWRAFMPRKKDFEDFWGMLRYNLGWSEKKPVFERYSYIEKAEYWALLWGSVVMVLTGALLTFENWTLKTFPKWAYDVASTIHFYEAVLATLAILVWHFYFTIFDPDQYPMNWSMTTGKADDHSSTPKDE